MLGGRFAETERKKQSDEEALFHRCGVPSKLHSIVKLINRILRLRGLAYRIAA
jgi:hypothetical protein